MNLSDVCAPREPFPPRKKDTMEGRVCVWDCVGTAELPRVSSSRVLRVSLLGKKPRRMPLRARVVRRRAAPLSLAAEYLRAVVCCAYCTVLECVAGHTLGIEFQPKAAGGS